MLSFYKIIVCKIPNKLGTKVSTVQTHKFQITSQVKGQNPVFQGGYSVHAYKL